MPTLEYSHNQSAWYLRQATAPLGFVPIPQQGVALTQDPYAALPFVDDATIDASYRLAPYQERFEASQALRWGDHSKFAPEYYEYQKAAMNYLAQQFETRETLLLADEPGVGKTIQALGLADLMGVPLNKVLIICPANLRLTPWTIDTQKWLPQSRPLVLTTGAQRVDSTHGPWVISYDLAAAPKMTEVLSWVDWKLIIVDEAHYLKNSDAKRTKQLLGSPRRPGLLMHSRAKKLLLTGTPFLNSPLDIWTLLSTLATDIFHKKSESWFRKRYTSGYFDGFKYVVSGARQTEDLNIRLRASGFMVGRNVEQVLPDLPSVRHNLVVFPQDATTAKIISKEAQFNAEDIWRHGGTIRDGALPALRREMGVAKAPACADWIKELLDGGVQKLLVFAYHREVVSILAEMLKPYGVKIFMGGMTLNQKQNSVSAFQTDENCRVFIGNIKAAGVGLTLTAAHTVVFVEADWVPANNEQALDRVRRIGQLKSINAYYLCVHKSLDVKVLGVAAKKAAWINPCLGR